MYDTTLPLKFLSNYNVAGCHNYLVFVLSYYVFLRSEFRVVMSVTISAWEQCSVRLYLQLFLGGIMSFRLFVFV